MLFARRRTGFVRALAQAAALACCAALLVGGCSVTRSVEDRLANLEQEITRKSTEIQEEFKATITNMAVEYQQYLKCEEIVRSWRLAQSAHHRDFGAYAAQLDALQGANALKKHYVQDSVADSMEGLCYAVEITASDTDYRMVFEMDKQALVRQYENKLNGDSLDAETREYLGRRIGQLRTADPCRIVATEQGASAGGQCGFAVEPEGS